MTFFKEIGYPWQVVFGDYADAQELHKFGFNLDTGTAGTDEDIWSRGGTWVPPTQDRLHNIASSDPNDTNTSGSGARKVSIQGISGGVLTTETINLNGVSNVATVNAYDMIHRMRVIDVGSGGEAAGTITATAQTDATVTAEIPAGEYNQTQMAIYRVPDGKTLYLTKLSFGIKKVASGAATGLLLTKDPVTGGINDTPWREVWQIAAHSQGASMVRIEFEIPLPCTSGGYVKMRCNADTNNLSVYGQFSGILRDS